MIPPRRRSAYFLPGWAVVRALRQRGLRRQAWWRRLWPIARAPEKGVSNG